MVPSWLKNDKNMFKGIQNKPKTSWLPDYKFTVELI